MDPATLGVILVIGLAAGFTGGLFGVGGGVLMVPALLYAIPGTTFQVAKAASLLAMSVATVLAVARHRQKGSADLKRGALLGVAGIPGAALGAFASELAPELVLRALFGLALVGMGARLVWGATPEPREISPRAGLAIALATGFGAGVIAGTLGVGGGILMVPALALTGVTMHLAVGTSLVAVLVNAWAATATNLALGYWSAIYAVGIPTAAGGTLGAWLGASAAHRLPAARLKWLFGAFLMLVGAWMALDAFAT